MLYIGQAAITFCTSVQNKWNWTHYDIGLFQEAGPLEEKGMVMGVLDKAFDVLVLKLGVVKRIYCEVSPLFRHLVIYWDINLGDNQKICSISLLRNYWKYSYMFPQKFSASRGLKSC